MPIIGMVQRISLIMSAQLLTSIAATLRGLWCTVPAGPSVMANQ